jgi:hypothetical protein
MLKRGGSVRLISTERLRGMRIGESNSPVETLSTSCITLLGLDFAYTPPTRFGQDSIHLQQSKQDAGSLYSK